MKWSYAIQPPAAAVSITWVLANLAGGPLGDVAVSANSPSGLDCFATSATLDPAGAATTGPSETELDSCAATVGPLAFDPEDGLLHGFSGSSEVASGFTNTAGFVAGAASVTYDDTSAPMNPGMTVELLGRATAGDSFALVSVSAPGHDFGGGVVTGNLLLHYGPTGTFVGSSPAPAGTVAIGALGDVFALSRVTGTVSYGCGTVGTAGVTSNVLTRYDATGACQWSKALAVASPTSLALDPSENVLLATSFTGTVDFGGGSLASAGTADLAVAKLTASGTFSWARTFGAAGSSVTALTAFGATATGGAALAASLGGSVSLGCGAVSSSAGATTLLADFDATGTVVFSRVVELVAPVAGVLMTADGLGGITVAAQLPNDCPCSPIMPCPSGCVAGFCSSCTMMVNQQPGAIVMSRFAP